MDWEIDHLNSTNDTLDPGVLYLAQFPMVTRILAAIVGLLSTTSNVLVILTVFKYSSLHNRTYWYIVNWCICNIFISASLPYMYNSFGFQIGANEQIMCVWDENCFNFLTGNQVFVAILVLDWYITTFANQRKCTHRCRQSFKIIIGVVWIFLFTLIIVTTFLCICDFTFSVPITLYGVSYLSIFLLFCVIFLLRYIKLKSSSIIVEKSKLEFRLAFSYFLCWLCNTVFVLNIPFVSKYFSSSTLHTIFQISMMIGFCHAIVLFNFLYILDRNFKICVRALFHLTISDSHNDIKIKQDLLEIL